MNETNSFSEDGGLALYIKNRQAVGMPKLLADWWAASSSNMQHNVQCCWTVDTVFWLLRTEDKLPVVTKSECCKKPARNGNAQKVSQRFWRFPVYSIRAELRCWDHHDVTLLQMVTRYLNSMSAGASHDLTCHQNMSFIILHDFTMLSHSPWSKVHPKNEKGRDCPWTSPLWLLLCDLYLPCFPLSYSGQLDNPCRVWHAFGSAIFLRSKYVDAITSEQTSIQQNDFHLKQLKILTISWS